VRYYWKNAGEIIENFGEHVENPFGTWQEHIENKKIPKISNRPPPPPPQKKKDWALGVHAISCHWLPKNSMFAYVLLPFLA
jgi:hypothetical protein